MWHTPNKVNDILSKGSAIYDYLCTEAKHIIKNAFPITLKEGTTNRKFLAVNKERFNPINFGIDYHKDGYCCQMINNTNVCQDFLDVMYENPITVNFNSFESPDADIYINSLKWDDKIEEIEIIIKGIDSDRCDFDSFYEQENETRIRCW